MNVKVSYEAVKDEIWIKATLNGVNFGYVTDVVDVGCHGSSLPSVLTDSARFLVEDLLDHALEKGVIDRESHSYLRPATPVTGEVRPKSSQFVATVTRDNLEEVMLKRIRESGDMKVSNAKPCGGIMEFDRKEAPKQETWRDRPPML